MPDADAGQIDHLKKAIQALESQRGTLGDAVVEASIAALEAQIAELKPQSKTQQQRKLVTLLFMDIAGSASMAQNMDPEDVSEIFDASLKQLAEPVEGHGGHVTRFMGDGFMAVFGSPVARENDPDKAVRAGLDILLKAQTIAGELQTRWGISTFQVRVGINTGLVLLGGETESEDTMMGSAVNLAARLESAAPAGGLLISHETYKHVRGLFTLEPREPVTAKGFDDPVRVYLVRGARPRAFRPSTRGVEGVETRMVGREAELKSLKEALKNAIEKSKGQGLTICGDAGVGKSRLLYEFQKWVELLPEQIEIYLGRAHQETQNQPYSLLRDLFMLRFQIQEDASPQALREKIEAGFRDTSDSAADAAARAHIIGQLLGFDFRDSPHVQQVLDDPQGLRDLGSLYIQEYLQSASQKAPLVLFLEDIHWADDSSLDLISRLTSGVAELPMLIVCLARPTLFERRPYWGKDQGEHHQLELNALTPWESRQLVEEILEKIPQVPAALRELVVGGAEGNPFYIEELIKMLIEKGAILKGDETWGVEPARLVEIEVPSTLTGVLQARLEGLPQDERLLLQGASVIGRIFWDHALEFLSRGDDDFRGNIRTDLGSLHRKELIFRRQESAFAGAIEYIFKHAILRDVTYESVLKRKRRVYHEQVAQWLIGHSPGRADEYSGLIGDHLERAGQGEKAIPYLMGAGERAARQYANAEAVSFFSRALALIPEDDLRRRYEVLLARERVYELQGLRELQEQDLSELKRIGQELDDVCLQAKAALRQVIFFNRTGNFPASLEMMEKAIKLAQQAEDINCEAALQIQWGVALWRQGKYDTALPTLEEAMAFANAADLDTIAGDGIRTLGPAFARTLRDQQSLNRFEQALEKYRQARDRRGEAYTLNNLGAYYAELKGNLTRAREFYEEALPIWREIGDRRGEGLTAFNLSVNAARAGYWEESIQWLIDSLEMRCQVGDRWGERRTRTTLGKFLCQQGLYDQVLEQYDQALAISREIGDRRGELVTLGLLGNYYRDLGEFDQAGKFYNQVLESWENLDQVQDQAEFLLNLGLLLHQKGEDQEGLERCQEVQELILGGDYLELEWMGLTVQGNCFAALGMLKEAEVAYKKASSKAQKWRRLVLGYEASAGFARVMMAKGKKEKALLGIEKLLSHLQNDPPAGPRSPLDGALEATRIYLTCNQVLQANRDGRAIGILMRAYDLVQSRAGTIESLELRASYLDNVPANRQIVAETAS